MTSVLERPQTEEAELFACPPNELPPSDLVRDAVLERSLPLRDDPATRQEFYRPGGVVRTEFTAGNDIDGMKVFYKDERVQETGAFKARGAKYFVQRNPSGHYTTYSTGSQGQSVGWAAHNAGATATVYSTHTMSPPKEEATRSTGADVVKYDSFWEAEQAAVEAGKEFDARLVRPFGDLDVISGQCSVGYEIVEDLEALEDAGKLEGKTVIIPVVAAGGGLLAGIAIPIWAAQQRGRLKNVVVVGVQPEGTDALRRGVEKIRNHEEPKGLFEPGEFNANPDALAIGENSLSKMTMAIANDTDLVAFMLTVTEVEIANSMDVLESELAGNVDPGVGVEPAAAVSRAAAAAFNWKEIFGEDIIFVVPVTGGKVSPETKKIYRQALIAASIAAFHKLTPKSLEDTVEERLNRDDYSVAELSGAVALHSATNGRGPVDPIPRAQQKAAA